MNDPKAPNHATFEMWAFVERVLDVSMTILQVTASPILLLETCRLRHWKVVKFWTRGMCKREIQCEFLHSRSNNSRRSRERFASRSHKSHSSKSGSRSSSKSRSSWRTRKALLICPIWLRSSCSALYCIYVLTLLGLTEPKYTKMLTRFTPEHIPV